MKAVDALARHGLDRAGEKIGGYIARQRWFSARGREVARTAVDDAVVLREDPSGDGVAVIAVVARVELAGGGEERYHVPLAVRGDASTVWEGNVVGTGERGGRPVVFYDALAGGEGAWAFWEVMRTGAELRGARGTIAARDTGLWAGEQGKGDGPSAIRPLGREQSNTSVVRAEREVLKVYRRLTAGVSPEVEMAEALVARGFTQVAAPVGVMEYRADGAEPTLLAVVQPYLSGATDGWALALTSLRDLLATAAEGEEAEAVPAADAVLAQGSSFIPEAERIGDLTARMHLAMADPGLPPALRPEAVTRATLRAWTAEMRADVDRVVETAGGNAEPLLAVRARILGAFDAVERAEPGGLAIRAHGDFHLGQLVRTNDGWTVLDFEGEPDRDVAARRARFSPLRDVAGMTRSLDYAAAIELRDWTSPDREDFALLAARAEAWARLNREAFWGAYVAVAGDLLPAGEAPSALLHAFELQKAVYELGYELGHRPDWASIPLRFLTAVGER